MTSARNQAENEKLYQRALTIFDNLRYETLDAADEQAGNYALTGRDHDSEVVLQARLLAALSALNTHIAADVRAEAIRDAVETLTANRALLDTAEANREIYKLLRDGVPVKINVSAGHSSHEGQPATVRLINWREPVENDFLLVRNFWVNGREGRGRLDFVGFVNGLPLLLPVIRAAGRRENPLQHLYETDINDYKRRFPQLFWYNALILLADGPHSKLGSFTATWEHFTEWKRIEDEEEPGDTSLETLLMGTCEKVRLLDIVENFTLFSEEAGGLIKIIGRNHQYLGVNAAFARMQRFKELAGKIGVFWHTQGAGKSYSMIFFEQKVQRKLPGNWRFLVITDRIDLDEQIYKNFRKVGAVTEPEESARVSYIKDLKPRLRENHSILFLLIQKFRTAKDDRTATHASVPCADPGLAPVRAPALALASSSVRDAADWLAPGEVISESDDIIVMTDEAHRSQYAEQARTMRHALPNASYLGFTGTPLIGEEIHRTRDTFGPYVSKYPFLRAIEDGVTVRLIYENRTPELGLNVAEVAQKIQDIEQKKDLNDKEKQKLRRAIFRQTELCKTSAYLDFIAEDIVAHFMTRGYLGKAMVVCIDKLTTVRLYNRVQQAWQRYQEQLEQRLSEAQDQDERAALAASLTYSKTTDMAVVVSTAETEENDAFALFNKHNPQEQVTIQPHYDRLNREKLDEKFKHPHDPLRIVFVCAMWMTGFDVPCLSTLYLDHSMTMHTLMQAIARPNRVYDSDKTCGQIVDYVGIYEDLVDALKIYATPEQGISSLSAEMPFSEKSELIHQLEQSLNELEQFCQQQGIDLPQSFSAITNAHNKMERDAHIQAIANALVRQEDVKLNYLSRSWYVYHLYQALLPAKEVSQFAPRIHIFRQIQQTIFAAMNCVNIAEVLAWTRRIVAEETTVYAYESRWSSDNPDVALGKFDLSTVNFAELDRQIQTANPYLQTEQLRSFLQQKLQQMIRVNPQRMSYLDRLQEIIHKHNENSANIADYPAEIVAFAREVREEELRTSREQLSEEELAIADLLTLNDPHTEADWQQIKALARKLLAELKSSGNLVDNWYNKPAMNSAIKLLIINVLDTLPEAPYPKALYNQKCEEVYRHIRNYYRNVGGDNGPISA
jgi:type I restriction enzyme R subunit